VARNSFIVSPFLKPEGRSCDHVVLAYEVAGAIVVRASEGVKAAQEYATAILIDLVGGFPF